MGSETELLTEKLAMELPDLEVCYGYPPEHVYQNYALAIGFTKDGNPTDEDLVKSIIGRLKTVMTEKSGYILFLKHKKDQPSFPPVEITETESTKRIFVRCALVHKTLPITTLGDFTIEPLETAAV